MLLEAYRDGDRFLADHALRHLGFLEDMARMKEQVYIGPSLGVGYGAGEAR